MGSHNDPKSVWAEQQRLKVPEEKKLIELKGELTTSIIIAGALNIPPHLARDKVTRHKTNRDMGDLNNTINRIYVT